MLQMGNQARVPLGMGTDRFSCHLASRLVVAGVQRSLGTRIDGDQLDEPRLDMQPVDAVRG